MHKLTILFVLCLFLGGCGQKGPLYHEKPAPENNQPAREHSPEDNSK